MVEIIGAQKLLSSGEYIDDRPCDDSKQWPRRPNDKQSGRLKTKMSLVISY